MGKSYTSFFFEKSTEIAFIQIKMWYKGIKGDIFFIMSLNIVHGSTDIETIAAGTTIRWTQI